MESSSAFSCSSSGYSPVICTNTLIHTANVSGRWMCPLLPGAWLKRQEQKPGYMDKGWGKIEQAPVGPLVWVTERLGLFCIPRNIPIPPK